MPLHPELIREIATNEESDHVEAAVDVLCDDFHNVELLAKAFYEAVTVPPDEWSESLQLLVDEIVEG